MSSNLIGWIVTLVFIVVLVAGFLIGLWRGLKRSTVNLVMAIIGVVLAFFITPLITDAILSISVTIDGTKTSLEAILVTMLKDVDEIADFIRSNENLEIILLNLPRALVNTIVFIFVTIAVELVLYIIFKILALTCFKIKEDEKKHRLGGAFVGLFKTFVVMLIAFMPLAGLTGMANNLLSTTDYGLVTSKSESSSIIEQELPEEAVNIVVGLEDNLLMKCCGIFGLDNAMFDYYSSFEVDEEKLHLREEVDNIYKVVDLSYQMINADFEELDYVTIRYDKLSSLVNNITQSTLFKSVISPTLSDMVINYDDYDFINDIDMPSQVEDILKDVGNNLNEYSKDNETHKYFQNDLNKVVNIAKILGQSGIINDLIKLQDTSLENVADIITKENNANAVSNALSNIFDLNIVRSSTENLINYGLEFVSSEEYKIDSSTKDWSDEDWEEFKTSVSNIVTDFGDISKEVDVFEVVEDATILLSSEKNYNIDLIASKFGNILDEVRANKLLKTSDGDPIIDDVLSENDITLPKEDVKNIEGKWVAVDSYTKYFEFIAPSLKLLRDEGVYNVIDDDSLSSAEMLEEIAEILSKEGNEDLLSKTILPLYQVEPTKSMIIDELANSLGSDLVDLSELKSYDEWDKDLTYISNMLITLNGIESGDETLLSMALNEDLDGLIDSLSEDNIRGVLNPILYAKSTEGLRDELFATIKSQLDNASGANSTISLSNITLIDGDAEDQAEEICDIIINLIEVNNALNDEQTIKTMDKAILGKLLNSMKFNAYRTTLSNKTEEGLFSSAFVDLVNKFKLEYQEEVEYIEEHPQILQQLGIDSLAEENYPDIDFARLLQKIEEIESLI